MILSNASIVDALARNAFSIHGLEQSDNPSAPPFNTSAVDLRLDNELVIPEPGSYSLDLSQGDIRTTLANNSRINPIPDPDQPYVLQRGRFVLGQTVELVEFPLSEMS